MYQYSIHAARRVAIVLLLSAILPIDAGAEVLTGAWNTNAESQVNRLRCINSSAEDVHLALHILDRLGNELSTTEISVAGGKKMRLSLTPLLAGDSFGTYQLEAATSGDLAGLRCVTLFLSAAEDLGALELVGSAAVVRGPKAYRAVMRRGLAIEKRRDKRRRNRQARNRRRPGRRGVPTKSPTPRVTSGAGHNEGSPGATPGTRAAAPSATPTRRTPTRTPLPRKTATPKASPVPTKASSVRPTPTKTSVPSRTPIPTRTPPPIATQTRPAPTPVPPPCADRVDNDGDGLIDFPRDPGCSSTTDRDEANAAAGLGAGASLGGRRAFPDDNPWNQDISGMPVDPRSATLVASIGLSKRVHPDFGTTYLGMPNGIPYTVVSGTQARVPITFDYLRESDAGPYPVPPNAPIQAGGGDRHILVVDKDNWKLYEIYQAVRIGASLRGTAGAVFDLRSNTLRPDGWTSADAAGLPIFPGLVRYDEVMEQGEIRHALRFTVSRSRNSWVYPARHSAAPTYDPSLPPMGMRVRLKSGYDITGFPQEVQVILRALKKYGMIVADNGGDWFISGAPDPRWSDQNLARIHAVNGADFEVIKMGTIVDRPY